MKLVLLSLLMSLTVFAEEANFLDLKTASTVIVRKLRNQGHRRIGNIDLVKLETEIMQTNWKLALDKFFIGSGESRATSICLTEAKLVIVNKLALPLIDKSIFPVVALHEALCANGYDDERAQISLSLHMLSKGPSAGENYFRAQLEKAVTGLTKNKEYKVLADGGTSVGSGGDGTAIEFKARLLQLALDLPAIAKNEVLLHDTLERIMSADIEPSWEHNVELAVKFERQGSTFRIVIPSVHWFLFNVMRENGESKKYELVFATLEKIVVDTL